MPFESPFAAPVLLLIVATAVLLLLHVPPAGDVVKVVLPPRQMNEVLSVSGSAFIVTATVVLHPAGSV